MEDHPAMPAGELDASGRPVKSLPASQLIRLSLYWLGLTSIFAGLGKILAGRLVFDDPPLVPKDEVGTALFLMNVGGVIVAMLLQPTVGTISDYTTSRWGRRKPYIVIGSLLDVVFLYGIATSNTVLSIAAFVTLLQVSSNFAQGPFQGYVPDLVPARQVGLASALVGLFNVLGNVSGFAIGSLAIYFSETNGDSFFLGLMALGLLELTTMLSVVIRVDEGRAPKPRGGRSWFDVAREAWGTDILRERSYLYFVGSRLFVLTGGSVLLTLATFYLNQTHGMGAEETGATELTLLAIVTIGTLLAVVPSARISDRIGRKKVIYASCAIGATGLALVAIAPSIAVALAGAAFFGISAGVFLAVDWALLTDIIPKATTGRYMGLSNVATASAGVLAIAIGGGVVMDGVNRYLAFGLGPRAALLFGVVCYVVGALLLVPVDERRREDTHVAAVVVTEPAG
jgi:MFS family permease